MPIISNIRSLEQLAIERVAAELRDSSDFETAMRVLTAIWRRA